MKTSKLFHRRKPLAQSMRHWVLLVAVLSQLPCLVSAQNDSLATHAYMFAAGSSNILDTYLSAEKYKGSQVRYLTTHNRPTRWDNLRQTILREGQLDVVSNRADNNDELGGMFRFQYHLRRHWNLHNGVAIEAGGALGAELGFLYNTRNSNNPAQAYASLQLMPSFAASRWQHVFRWPVRFSYEASAPLFGLMFSPNYGQSYYEIFSRANYDHNLVPTTLAATPSMRHMLTADIPLSRRHPARMLRLGYLGDYQQAKLNNLKRHQFAHMLVIGLTVTK